MKPNTEQNTLKHGNYTESQHDHQSCHHSYCKHNGPTREVLTALPERHKLFNKVVTQSDIKHHRLAIPKHQVKKHFPQHVSTSSKGASLCMEDEEGQIWKFRLSFCKSCQGYVITQEWNRFVQRKSLRTGDTVSFLCSTGPEKRLYVESEQPNRSRKAQKSELFEPTPKSPAIKLFGVVISTT